MGCHQELGKSFRMESMLPVTEDQVRVKMIDNFSMENMFANFSRKTG